MTSLEKLRTALAERYSILREIGAGGMATVYLARDLRHERDVALKLLKPELGAVLGPDRFLSEIRVTAKLQHPNLLPLFDSGETDGQLWYVMPFVEGEGLRGRLDREKQLPIREAVRIGSAVASALDYAHRHGVIHRDLKPENILLSEDQPLVADFGIALAVSNAGGERVTQTGLSLGTPQYMSPEQATGEREVDGRADIYSLGAVLYEMLSGEPPHTGQTVQTIIARVITDTPKSLRASRASVPEHVDLAVAKALEKVPADRFETAKEFSEVLQGQKAITASRTAANPSPRTAPAYPVPARRGNRLPWIVAGASALIAIAAIAFGAKESRRGTLAGEPEPVSFTVTPAGDERIEPNTVAISADGRRLVYVGSDKSSSHLYVRDLADINTRSFPETERGDNPFFSPDGRWLAFFSDGELKRLPVDGGSPLTIAANVVPVPSWWTADNRIIIPTQALTRHRSGLSEVPSSGGVVKPIIASDTVHGENMGWPISLADGKTILFGSLGPGASEDDKLAVASLGSPAYAVLDFLATKPLGYLDGYILCLRWDGAQGTIVALPVDLRARKITGDPIGLQGKVAENYAAALSQNGTLAFVTGGATAQLVAEDRKGKVDTLLSELRDYESPRFSPDGTRIAFAHSGSVWVYDIPGRTLSRLPTGDGESPEWYSDGRRILFDRATTATAGLLRQPADGSAPPEQLHPKLPSGVGIPFNAVLSPDQTTIAFVVAAGNDRENIYYFKPAVDDVARPWVATPFDDLSPRFSPDGKLIAYVSDESGKYEVYVRPFPGPGSRVQISSGGGTEPVWARDGTRIYYRNGQKVIEADFTPGAVLSLGARRSAFSLSNLPAGGSATYDVSRDGERIVFAQPSGGDAKLVVIVNWFTEVRRKLKRARP
ncbi:MAG: protein kinase domain-containing protein [Gemmatimonadaceae bacterium]